MTKLLQDKINNLWMYKSTKPDEEESDMLGYLCIILMFIACLALSYLVQYLKHQGVLY